MVVVVFFLPVSFTRNVCVMKPVTNTLISSVFRFDRAETNRWPFTRTL